MKFTWALYILPRGTVNTVAITLCSQHNWHTVLTTTHARVLSISEYSGSSSSACVSGSSCEQDYAWAWENVTRAALPPWEWRYDIPHPLCHQIKIEMEKCWYIFNGTTRRCKWFHWYGQMQVYGVMTVGITLSHTAHQEAWIRSRHCYSFSNSQTDSPCFLDHGKLHDILV